MARSLYLIRHGEAESQDIDARRPLTKRGQEESTKTGQLLRNLNIKPDEILHSSKLRAQQTAQIIQKELSIKAPLLEKEYLSPDDTIDKAVKEIVNTPSNLMIVGHMPFLARLVSKLVINSDTQMILRFQESEAVILEEGPNRSWLISNTIIPD